MVIREQYYNTEHKTILCTVTCSSEKDMYIQVFCNVLILNVGNFNYLVNLNSKIVQFPLDIL